MKSTCLALLILTNVSLWAQSKGVTQLSEKKTSVSHSTYAVVLGISDYQDPGIPDLKYADKDAEKFASFLHATADGTSGGHKMKVLINSKATMAQFIAALEWLKEDVRENDQVVIYYSGYVDTERNSNATSPYFLCWDALYRLYTSGGTIHESYLQKTISILNNENKAKVIFIAHVYPIRKILNDINQELQPYNWALSKQVAHKTKIISATNEDRIFDLDSKEHGQKNFSNILLDALYGSADYNKDLSITLEEINRYLEQEYRNSTFLSGTMPVLTGNKKETLFKVKKKIFRYWKKHQSLPPGKLFVPEWNECDLGNEGILDSQRFATYQLFIEAVNQKRFFKPTGNCADHYYQKLVSDPEWKLFSGCLKRFFITAILESSQQVLYDILNNGTCPNKKLETGFSVLGVGIKKTDHTDVEWIENLKNGYEMVGIEHAFYPLFKFRYHLFRASSLILNYSNLDQTKVMNALAELRSAVEWQSQSELPYFLMCSLFGNHTLEMDSMELYGMKAIEMNNYWPATYLSMANIFLNKFNRLDKAAHYLDLAVKRDTQLSYSLASQGYAFLYKQEWQAAEEYLLKAMSVDTSAALVYKLLFILYANTGQFEVAERYAQSALHYDPTDYNLLVGLGQLYLQTGRGQEGLDILNMITVLDSSLAEVHSILGNYYYNSNQFEKAIEYFKNSTRIDSTNARDRLLLGYCYLNMGEEGGAKVAFTEALKLDSSKFEFWAGMGDFFTLSEKFEDAAYYYNRALRIDSNQATLYASLGKLYVIQEKYHLAILELEKAFNLDQSNLEVTLILSASYLKMNRLNEAETFAEHGLKIDSMNMSLIDGMGEIQLEKDNLELAESYLSKALQMNPESGSTLYSLSRLYAQKNKLDVAYAYFEKALQAQWCQQNEQKVRNDPKLEPLRKIKVRWNKLMQKYFPDKMK